METTASANSSAKASKILWTLLVISALWCLLALLGFPFPQTDDVYYIGAGINLANGGHLVNPMVEPLAPFYAYPPTQSYVIAGWLKLFGISAASFVSLYLLFCWITTVCLVRGFQILGRDLLGWMAALTFVVVSASVGVRADDCGFCFLAISFLLGVSRHASIRYWAPFFALLAVSAVPAAMAIAFPWIIYLVATYKHMWKAAFVGGAAMAVLLCAMVEWHLGAFLAGFLETSHRAGLGAGVWLMENWYRPMGALKSVYPVAVLAVLMGFSVLRRGFRLIDPLVILSLVLALYSMFVTVSGYRVMSLITVIAIGMYICILLPDSAGSSWPTDSSLPFRSHVPSSRGSLKSNRPPPPRQRFWRRSRPLILRASLSIIGASATFTIIGLPRVCSPWIGAAGPTPTMEL